MTLHFQLTDAERYRECPPCAVLLQMDDCTVCDGTGRVLREGIDPDAEPEIEIDNCWDEDHQHLVQEDASETQFLWRLRDLKGDLLTDSCACGETCCWGHWLPKGSTQAEALTAARRLD